MKQKRLLTIKPKHTRRTDTSTLVKIIPSQKVVQGSKEFYLFHIDAASLAKLTEVNRREEGKEEGYQRVISPSRTRSISRYIQGGGVIPGSIVISLDNGTYDDVSGMLSITGAENVGWVIDGQHRLVGAWEASKEGKNIDLAVIAFLNASIDEQIELFVTINREAKGVPASLYLDLLKDLPRRKTDKERVDERITDIARRLYNDENSPFFQRLIFTRTAKAGEISVVNFARIFRPIVARQSGVLGLYTQPEQEGAINNYYKALITAFPTAADKDVFFRTNGFGAVWRAFPLVLNLTLVQHKAFNVASIAKVLRQINHFDFLAWTQLGSGTAAEIQAGDDLIATLQEAFSDKAHTPIALKLD